MSTSAITSSTSSTSTTSTSNSSTSESSTLDYNSFLQLLVAQLQNQDPTDPTDPTQFISQLASFSSVEQLVNANSRLDTLLTQNAISQGASLIGKTVTSADGTVSGVIKSIEINSSGSVATLADGSTIELASGVVIS
ncbi:flagellar hook assembly protein FlgD [Rhodomicrobium lacus]|uniref:flagellar hook assembly protein FlgD n=1 Tax=Rhodomicrobium lacus TaxID=2498452 RepID=UPI0026E22B8F|nr:flagellar hook assembly protein FlgD [Rhodomicrobium lacus]WKW50650.1 flagellar hook assembly protein FlgD [Rhodomicrobium lacus]